MAGRPEMIDTAEISAAMVESAPQIRLPLLDAQASSWPRRYVRAKAAIQSFDRYGSRFSCQKFIITGPLEIYPAGLGRDRGERQKRIGSDSRMQFGAEYLHPI